MIKNAIARSAATVTAVFLMTLLFLPAMSEALTVGEKAPDFHLVTPQGREISYYKEIRGNKPVYLFFWTTW